MGAQIIDGKALAQKMRDQMREEVVLLKTRTGQVPGLATVVVGNDPASHVYVNSKIRSCKEVGINAFDRWLPHEATLAVLLDLLNQLAQDSLVHGILVQMPLPKHIADSEVFTAMPAQKDVDGFSFLNWGRFFKAKNTRELNDVFVPCTPLGILAMLDSAGISVDGKLACVVGRSSIVGRPMAHLLTLKNATVVVCHSHTQNMDELTRKADLIVVAIGKPNFLKEPMIKPGACVIDVGVNRLSDGMLVGDCDTKGLMKKAGHISPVPGGVGPMTIAMLLKNTLAAFKRTHLIAS